MSSVRSVQSLSRVRLFATPWIAARQASLSITNSRSSLRLTSIKSVMPSSHLILCRPLLLLPPVPSSIRVFSNESTLRMRHYIIPNTTILLCHHYCVYSVLHYTSLLAQTIKSLSAMQETWVQSQGWEDPLEENMATPSSILAWRIPWTEDPGRLQSMGLQRVRHNWAPNILHYSKVH